MSITRDGYHNLYFIGLRTERILIALAIFLGLALRLRVAALTYLNPDEIQYFFLSLPGSFKELFLSVLQTDHPPLLFFLTHPIASVTSAEICLRLIPVLAGSAFPWVIYLWLAKVWNAGAGFAALVILTFSPNLIFLSAELRGYTLELLFAALALLFLDTALEKGSTRQMILFTISLYLAILSEYSAAWIAGSLGFYFLLRAAERRISRSLWVLWALGQAGALAIYAVLYQVAMKPRLAVKDPAVAAYLRHAFPEGYKSLVAFVTQATLGQFAYAFSAGFLGIAGALLFVGALVMLWKGRSRAERTRNRIFAVFLVIPFLLACSGAILKLHPYGKSRHTVVLSLFVAAGAGIALERMLRARLWIAGFAVLALGLVWYRAAEPDPNGIGMFRARRTFIMAGIQYMRASLPPGSFIMTDRETNRLLNFYLLGDRELRLLTDYDTPELHRVGPFRVIWRNWDFGDGDLFLQDLASVRRELGLSRDVPIWVADGGFGIGLDERLRKRFPGASFQFHDFNGAMLVFQVPPDLPEN